MRRTYTLLIAAAVLLLGEASVQAADVKVIANASVGVSAVSAVSADELKSMLWREVEFESAFVGWDYPVKAAAGLPHSKGRAAGLKTGRYRED